MDSERPNRRSRRDPVSPSECARLRALPRALIVPPSRQASDSLRVFLSAAVSGEASIVKVERRPAGRDERGAAVEQYLDKRSAAVQCQRQNTKHPAWAASAAAISSRRMPQLSRAAARTGSDWVHEKRALLRPVFLSDEFVC